MTAIATPTLFANPESFLRQLFAALEQAGIGYVVLRNHESYPHKVDKPDVGLLVHDRHLKLLESTFRQVAADLGHSYCSQKDGANIASLYAVQIFDRVDDWEISSMKLHVRAFEPFVFSSWMRRIRGHNYKVMFDAVETRLVEQDGCTFRILAPADSFVMLLKQWRRKQDPRHRQELERAITVDSLRSWFETSTAVPGEELPGVLDAPTSKKFDLVLGRLAESLWGRRTMWRYVKHQSRAMRQLLFRTLERWRQTAPMYYFSGPDGCGKTTTVNIVQGFFRSQGIRFRSFYTLHKFLRHLGFRCRWLLHLANKGRTPFRKFQGIGGGHLERETGRLWKVAKFAGLLCSIVDLFIGWCWAWLLRRRGIIVLVEASPHDLFVKYHMPEFPLLERLVLPMIPSPRRGFLMVARPEAIVERKAELTVREIQHYYERIALVHRRAGERNYLPIRTDITPTATAVDVMGAILGSIEES